MLFSPYQAKVFETKRKLYAADYLEEELLSFFLVDSEKVTRDRNIVQRK